MRRIRKDESGQVLVLSLAFIAFLGVLSVAVLDSASTNLKASVHLRPVRAEQAAADGAVEGAINKLRQFEPARLTGATWVSDAPCPSRFYILAPDAGRAINVDCGSPVVAGPSGSVPANRTVTFTACPALTFTDAITTSGSKTLTSATAAFKAEDAGRRVTGPGIPSGTTIATVTSATTVTLNNNATATTTGVAVTATCSQSATLLVARVQFSGTPPNVASTVKSWSVIR